MQSNDLSIIHVEENILPLLEEHAFDDFILGLIGTLRRRATDLPSSPDPFLATADILQNLLDTDFGVDEFGDPLGDPIPVH